MTDTRKFNFNKDAAIAKLAKMPDDEPVFVLRAHDVAASHAINSWIDWAGALGAKQEKLDGAEEHLMAFIAWQSVHGTKVPD